MSSFIENLVALLKFIGNFIKGFTIAVLYILKAVLLFFVPKCLRYKDVSKDIVLITGGASGLGRLMAIKFAKLGSRVVIWDLNLAGLEETAKMIEELRSKKENIGHCHYYQVDISNRFNVYAAAERVKQEIGTVTILVNNAGIVTGKRFLECSDEQIIKTFDVNALAHFWILKAFLPAMMEKNHGHIVSLASIAGLVGAYQLTDYCSSKFAAGMFAGIGRSLIPILTPQYVVDETVKAVLVNQEVLCLPTIVYLLVMLKTILPTKSFLWGHWAIGAASTMKTFTGRNLQNQQHQPQNKQHLLEGNHHISLRMTAPDIGITIPDIQDNKLQLNQ